MLCSADIVRCGSLWNEIEPFIHIIMESFPIPPSQYLKLYSIIFKYCNEAHFWQRPKTSPIAHQRMLAAELFKRLSVYFMGKIGRTFYLRLVSSLGPTLDFLRVFVREFDIFEANLKKLNGIFSYINRYWRVESIPIEIMEYFPDAAHISSVYGEGILYWRRIILDPTANVLTTVALAIIDEDRRGEATEEKLGLVKKLVEAFVAAGHNTREAFGRRNKKIDARLLMRTELISAAKAENFEVFENFDVEGIAFYKSKFHEQFIGESTQFFKSETFRLVGGPDDFPPIKEYWTQFMTWLNSEIERVQKFLHVSSIEDLKLVLGNCFIFERMNYIYKQISQMFAAPEDHDNICLLQNLFELFQYNQDILQQVVEIFKYQVGILGKNRIERLFESDDEGNFLPVDPERFVSVVAKLYRSFENLVKKAFPACSMFNTALDSVFCEFANPDQVLGFENVGSTELLAKYCDSVVRRNGEEPKLIKKCLSNAMIVFKFLEDKDLFQKFYTKLLARRLLLNAAGQVNRQSEIEMLVRLRVSCGYEYTRKLFRIIQDVDESLSFNGEIHDQCHALLDFEFSGIVTTAGSWPFSIQPNSGYEDVPELAQACAQFETQYIQKHEGRKIQWLPHLGRVELRATFGTGQSERQYLLQLSAFQTRILLMFDEPDTKLSKTTISETTHLSECVVTQVLAIFVEATIMLFDSDEELYWINEEFVSERFKLNLNRPLKAEIKQEQEKAERMINESRTFMTRAAIVRTMKSLRRASENDLVKSVAKSVESRFKAKREDVKALISELVEADYLKKADSGGDSQEIVYEYVA